MPSTARPRPPLWRRWRVVVAALAAIGCLIVGGLHLPFARARVLSWVSAELARQGFRFTADRLSYNLFSLTVGLDRVVLAATGGGPPVFEADAVRLNLPFAALRGALRVQSIEIDRPRVRVVRRADGSWNLPESPSAANRSGPLLSGPLELDRVVVRNMEVEYTDAIQGVAVEGRGLSLDLQRMPGQALTGRLAMNERVSVRQGDRATSVSTLAGQLSFDGRSISIAALDIAAPEGRTRIAGTVGPFTAEPRLNLEVEAALDAGRIASWLTARPPPIGPVALQARMTGPFAAPVAEIASLRAALSGGDVEASGRVPLGGDGPSEAFIRWQRVDAGALARAATTLPIRPAAIADGDLTLTWTGQDWFGARGRLRTSLREPAASRAELSLTGRIDASLDDRRWTVTMDSLVARSIAVAGTAGGRLDDDLGASSLGGRTTVRAANVQTALLRLKEAGLDLGAVPVEGAMNAAIDLGGTLRAPRTTATVNANVGPNVVSGNVAVDFATRALSGHFDGDLPQLSAIAAAVPERWRPDGTGRIAGQLGGTLDRPVIDANVAADNIRISGEVIDSVRSTVRVADGTVTVATFEAAQDKGRLTATGQYSFAERRYALNATGTSLAIDYAPVRASGDVRLNSAGTIDRPEAAGLIEFSRLELAGYSLAPASADVMFSGGRLQVRSTLPSLGGQLDATIDLDTRSLAATAAIADADLSKLTTTSPVALAGSISLRATAAGSLDDVTAMAIGVDLTAVDANVNGVPIQLSRPATLRHEHGQLVATDLEMRLGGSSIAVNGRLGAPADSREALRLDLRGSLGDLLAVARLAPDLTGVEATGAISLRAEARGPIRAPALTGSFALSNASVRSGELPPVTGIAVTAAFADGRLDVTGISGRWQGAEFSATARLPASVLGLTGASGLATADLKVSSITPEALAPFVDRETLDRITGRVDLSASLQAVSLDVNSLTGSVTLDHAAMELARVPIRQTVPTRLRLANRRLEVESWRWTGAGSEIDVIGSVRLADEGPHLDVGISGTVDLRMLGAFMPDVAVAGLAKLDVRAAGRATDPEVAGGLAIADTDVILRNPRLAITGLRGAAIFTQRQLQLRDVTGMANGGELRLGGTIDYGGASPAGGTLSVTGRGMAFELVEGLRTDVNADLRISLTEPAIRGRVTVLRGDYRRRIRLTDFLGGSGGAAIAPPVTGPGAFDAIRLDIAISTADDIVVDNNYGRFEVSSQLTLVGTIAEPALAGRLALREGGRVFLSGRTYTVRRGFVTFTNPSKIEPQLDLALDTRVQQDEITLELTGTPDALDVSLRSPGLSQQDAVSLLLTGQRADDASVAYSEIAQGQLLMLLSGELLGAAGQAVGLDSVQVSRGLGAAASTFDLLSTESNPDARLTLSKNLRRDVELIVSQNLRKTGDITWILAYHPTRRIDLRAATDDDDSRTYEFRHEVPFGGGTRPAGEGIRTTSAPSPRIARVDVRNAPESLAAELRGELQLEAGDRFDFYRWQEDRERLVRTLRDRGFLEARVAARRQDSGPDTIDVIYEVTPGPRTTLEVANYTLPAAAIAEMKTAWAQTLFDEFLKEDLTAIATRALIDAGHMKGEVTTTIETGADQKSALVRIDPGPRFVDRRVEFEGNRDVASAALAAIVHDRGLDVSSWQEPAPLITALEDHYRSLGYLGASVSVAPPQFEETTAILPVRVEEGPQYRVGEVRVDGAAAPAPADVRATFAIEPGVAYRPGDIEPARRRVETAYRQRGYNQVRVRVAAAPEPTDARVNLTLTIAAGPQQVLEAVEISGAQVTSLGVVDRVLKLPVGRPVSLGEVYTAQKRVYDTGVFQSVELSLVPLTSGTETAGVQPVRAAVTLRELPRFRLRYGFRITDVAEPAGDVRQIQPGFVTDLLDRNLFGRAIAAGIAGQVEADRALGRAFLSLPTLFRRAVVTNVFVTQSREEIAPEGETPFVDRTLELTVEQKLKPRAKMAVTYGLSFGRKHVYDPNPDPDSLLPPIDFRTNITRATGTYAWDTRDDPSDASRGWFHSSGLEYGVEALGSDLRFVRYLAQQYYIKRAARRVVFASAIRLGAARGFDQELIPSERFYAGGGTSVRGFAEDGLGPRSILGDPDGGNGLLVLNQEMRVRVHRWFGAVAFVDAGNVFPTAREISFTKLEAGAGAGLRVISPFAILRVDFGVPLTNRTVNPAARWYFGIGHTF